MMIYIKFEIKKPTFKEGIIKKIIKKILFLILPKANPDYDSKINFVKTWILEFENMNSVPVREIGLNEKNEVILKMPYKNNYGYWTDNLLKFSDFERLFNINRINEELFNKLWEYIK